MADQERLEALLTLKDEFSDKLKEAQQKAKAFKEQAEKIKPQIKLKDLASKDIKRVASKLRKLKSGKNIIKIKAKDGATKNIIKIKAKLAMLKAKTILLKAKDKASKIIGSLGKKLRAIIKKRWDARIGVKDRASGALNKIKALLGVLAAGVVIKATLQSGAKLQQQKVSMEHFMGVGNRGKSKSEIQKMTGDYMGQLRNNANATPYETGEVVSAGTRALTISQGNSKQAMRLVKLSEDMAAADPNKTLGDAIEAIADAQMGEFERMKEFGFKGSKEAFDKADGDFFKMKDSNGRTTTETFGGLAKKQANTAQGKFSTIKGNITTAQQNLGEGILKGMDPTLTKLREKMGKLLGGEDTQSKFIQFGEKIGQMFDKVIGFATRVGKTIKSVFEMFFGNWDFDALAGRFAPVIQAFSDFFGAIENKTPLAQAVFGALGAVVEAVVGIIGLTLTAVVTVIRTVFDIINGIINVGITVVKTFPQTWENAKETIREVVQIIKDKCKHAMDGIKNAIEGAKKVIDDMKETWMSLKHKIENNPITQTIRKVGEFVTGGDGENPNTHAYGLNRVPYNGYKTRLHEGERVLTKNEANILDNNSGNISGGVTININATIREDSDINKIVHMLVREMKRNNLGGGMSGSMA